MKRVLAGSLGALLSIVPAGFGADELLWHSGAATSSTAAPTGASITQVSWHSNTPSSQLPPVPVPTNPPAPQPAQPRPTSPSTPSTPPQAAPTLSLPPAATIAPAVPARAECGPAAVSYHWRPLAPVIKPAPFGAPEIRISPDYPDCWECLHQVVPHAWVRAELLLWWVNRDQAPPLVTTGPATGALFPNGTPRGGSFADPGTVILAGGDGLGDTFRQGGRFSAGVWFDCAQTCGIDGNFFFLGRRGTTEAFTSNEFPLLARPIFAPNVDTGFGLPGPFRELVAFPGLLAGAVGFNTTSELWGAEINGRKRLCGGCGWTLDAFAGFRYLDLDEDLRVAENILTLVTVVAPQAPAGSMLVPAGTNNLVSDDFAARNHFYGGQVGLDFAYHCTDRFSLTARPVVALGVNAETLDIAGAQLTVPPAGAPVATTAGGLLATATNIGHYTHSAFSVVPQVTLTAGYQVTSWFRAFAGYDFLFWSNVIRPGQQIDPVVDVSLVPPLPNTFAPDGQNRPAVLFQQSSFWAQGVNFGIELRW